MTADTLGRQLPLHHHLGGDTGMVGTHLPQGVVATHPVVADEGVHDGLLETVAHVQAAGDVRRRNHDAVGALAALWGKIAARLPLLVPAGFDISGLEGFFHGSSSPVSVCFRQKGPGLYDTVAATSPSGGVSPRAPDGVRDRAFRAGSPAPCKKSRRAAAPRGWKRPGSRPRPPGENG